MNRMKNTSSVTVQSEIWAQLHLTLKPKPLMVVGTLNLWGQSKLHWTQLLPPSIDIVSKADKEQHTIQEGRWVVKLLTITRMHPRLPSWLPLPPLLLPPHRMHWLPYNYQRQRLLLHSKSRLKASLDVLFLGYQGLGKQKIKKILTGQGSGQYL